MVQSAYILGILTGQYIGGHYDMKQKLAGCSILYFVAVFIIPPCVFKDLNVDKGYDAVKDKI